MNGTNISLEGTVCVPDSSQRNKLANWKLASVESLPHFHLQSINNEKFCEPVDSNGTVERKLTET